MTSGHVTIELRRAFHSGLTQIGVAEDAKP